MVDDKLDDAHISISPTVFYLLLAAAGFGGLGGGSVLTSQAERPAFQQCIDNSDVALDVAAQHGRELQSLRDLIYERTQEWSSALDARKDWNEQFRRDEAQERRLTQLEKEMDRK